MAIWLENVSQMGKPLGFLTPIQKIALRLTFAYMGESQINRTYDEYMAIAARLPPLKQLEFEINRLLRHLHECDGCNGAWLPELCGFKAGHTRWTYEPYPKTISYETIRAALEISGMRRPRWSKS